MSRCAGGRLPGRCGDWPWVAGSGVADAVNLSRPTPTDRSLAGAPPRGWPVGRRGRRTVSPQIAAGIAARPGQSRSPDTPSDAERRPRRHRRRAGGRRTPRFRNTWSATVAQSHRRRSDRSATVRGWSRTRGRRSTRWRGAGRDRILRRGDLAFARYSRGGLHPASGFHLPGRRSATTG